MKPVGNGISEQCFRSLVENGLLPDTEQNDGYIIAETSLAGIMWLISSDHHLCKIPETELNRVLKNLDLSPLTICSPRRFQLRNPRNR